MRFVLEIANHKNISKQRSARYILLHEQVPGRLFFLKAPNVRVIAPLQKFRSASNLTKIPFSKVGA